MKREKLQKKFTLSCDHCDSCTEVKIYQDQVELCGCGQTKGKIVMPKEEFDQLKEAIRKGKL